MALDKHDDEIQTSLHGRKIGLDRGGHVVGAPGIRHSFETVTAASTIERSGVTVIESTEAITVTLAAPEYPGVEKRIVNLSTFANVIVRSTAEGACSFYGSTGTDQEGTTITFAGSVGPAVAMMGVDSSRWAFIESHSTASFAVSTST
jgi:hypothetical protein